MASTNLFSIEKVADGVYAFTRREGQPRDVTVLAGEDACVLLQTIAAAFDSGWDFVELFAIGGGMPTRVTIPERRRLVIARTPIAAQYRKLNQVRVRTAGRGEVDGC